MSIIYKEVKETTIGVYALYIYTRERNRLANFFVYNSYPYRKFCTREHKKLQDNLPDEDFASPLSVLTLMEQNTRRDVTAKAIEGMLDDLVASGEWVISDKGKVNPVLLENMRDFFKFKSEGDDAIDINALIYHVLGVLFNSPYETYVAFKDLACSPIATFFPRDIYKLEHKLCKLLRRHIVFNYHECDYRVDDEGKLYLTKISGDEK